MIHKDTCEVYNVSFIFEDEQIKQHVPVKTRQPSSRVLRLVKDTTRFLWLSFSMKIPRDILRPTIERYVANGFELNSER